MYDVRIWSHRSFLFIISLWLIPLVRGHGRLIEPPSRASAWRYGFQTPPNYNDHELYCGGFSRQYQRNEGKCGICGDAWDLPTPRPHEWRGIYGQGIIVRRYNPDSVITIRVELTANHFGYFEFKLCQNYKNTTQQCLNRHLLRLASSYSTRFNGKLVQDDPQGLPNITCAHCVLQWTYTAGNNWGNCPNGTGAVGCGPQETFRACADISIGKHILIDNENENEIPNNSEETNLLSSTVTVPIDNNYRYDGFKTLIVVGVSLFLVILFISLLYTYYYQLGKRVKGWLKFDKPKSEIKTTVVHGIILPPPPNEPAPVPPPRIRKNSNTTAVQYDSTKHNNKMYNVHLTNESLA